MTAIVHLLVVLPMKTLVERRARGAEPGPGRSTQVELLVEIRDLLRARQERDPVQRLAVTCER